MEKVTTEQLENEKNERNAILAELYLSKKENEDLKKENSELSPLVINLKQEVFSLNQQVLQRQNILSDVGKHLSEIARLGKIKSDLANIILEIENNPEMLSLVGQKNKMQKEISSLQTDIENLTKQKIELAESNSDIENRINVLVGRLAELEIIDEKSKNTISAELADLNTQKSVLETGITSKITETKLLDAQKNRLIEAINTLTEIYNKIFEKASVIEGIVGNVKKASNENIVEVRELFIEMGEKITDVLNKTKESSDGADVILKKLPRWIFELQRPVSLKRQPPRMINRVIPNKNI